MEILRSKQAKRFYWNTANGIIGLLITYFSGLDWTFAPFIIALLNGLSKEIDNEIKHLKFKRK